MTDELNPLSTITDFISRVGNLAMGRRKICLAMSGGAARAIAHIGVLRALTRAAIPIDSIVATSGGALIGVFYAAGWTPEQMIEVVPDLTWRRLTKVGFSKMGLVSAEPIERLIVQKLGDITFEELKIPMAIVATDLVKGQPVIFNSGRVADKVKAACSFPGIFKPVEIDGKMLCDGGIFENVPVHAARDKMKAEVVIAVDTIPEAILESHPHNVIEIVDRAVDLVLKQRAKHLQEESDIYLEPVRSQISSFDLEAAEQLVRWGDDEGARAVDEIRRKARLSGFEKAPAAVES